jgi:peptide/nickel transport system permease protein
LTLDLGYSLANYPARVSDLIGHAMPWTVGLMLMGFVFGTLLGALSAWPGSPRWLRKMAVPLMTMSAIPPYLLGLIVLYILGFKLKLFPRSVAIHRA